MRQEKICETTIREGGGRRAAQRGREAKGDTHRGRLEDNRIEQTERGRETEGGSQRGREKRVYSIYMHNVA